MVFLDGGRIYCTVGTGLMVAHEDKTKRNIILSRVLNWKGLAHMYLPKHHRIN